MEPVSMIIEALAVGATAGVTGTVTAAFNDTYETLKRAVARHLADDDDAQDVLLRHTQDPETWEKPLASHLRASDAAGDTELIATASRLLRMGTEAGPRIGRNVVDVRDSQGTIVGDGAQVSQVFGSHGTP